MGSVAPWHVGSSQTRDWTRVCCIGRQILNHCTTREVPIFCYWIQIICVLMIMKFISFLLMQSLLSPLHLLTLTLLYQNGLHYSLISFYQTNLSSFWKASFQKILKYSLWFAKNVHWFGEKSYIVIQHFHQGLLSTLLSFLCGFFKSFGSQKFLDNLISRYINLIVNYSME